MPRNTQEAPQMLGRIACVLSAMMIERIESSVQADLAAGKLDAAQKGIQTLLRTQPRNRDAALALIRVVERRRFGMVPST
jgi:hypothetical protein